MRAQAEQTGAAPQPIRRAEGPEPGLLARASQVCGRGQEGGAGWGTEEITVQLKIYTHSRTKPGLSTVQTEPRSPLSHPKMLQVRADSSTPLPTCGKGGRRGGGAEAEGPTEEGNVNAHFVCPGSCLPSTTSTCIHPSRSRFYHCRDIIVFHQVRYSHGSRLTLRVTLRRGREGTASPRREK